MEAEEPNPEATIAHLKAYFTDRTQCEVFDELKDGYVRFYFHQPKDRNWRYILDISRYDVEQTAAELEKQLEASNWQQVLLAYSGKSVPRFSDQKFENPSNFAKWPEKVTGSRL